MADEKTTDDPSTESGEKRKLDGASHSGEDSLEHEMNPSLPVSAEEGQASDSPKRPKVESENEATSQRELPEREKCMSASPIEEGNECDDDDDDDQDYEYGDEDYEEVEDDDDQECGDGDEDDGQDCEDGNEDEGSTEKSEAAVDGNRKVVIESKGKGKMVEESQPAVDRKGKGIMIEDKGKGKMFEGYEAVVDRKAKGIVIHDKGKDKLSEESEGKGKGIVIVDKWKGQMVPGYEDDYVEVDDSDDDDDDTDTTEDSDFSYGPGVDGEESDAVDEDLLAEVDLDNILPSRTRRGAGGSGGRISDDKDKGKSVNP